MPQGPCQKVCNTTILRNGPEHYARALERGDDSLVRSAARQLERQATDLERSANSLARRLASARERHVQDRLLWIVGIVGVLAGIFLILLLPRFLPTAVLQALSWGVIAAAPAAP